MKSNERKLKILQAIIHNYILNAEPIGSRTISKKYNLGVSPATIRNEMSDLEELGYLLQPHTSSGRIPSNKAYRLYVDGLMEVERDLPELKHMRKKLINEMGEIERLIENSAKILSKVTNYTSLAIAPQMKQSRLKHIQLLPIDTNKILLVVITNTGIVKNTIIKSSKDISNERLNTISNYLTNRLKGQLVGQIEGILNGDILNEMHNFKHIINKVITKINKSLDNIESVDLYSDGITKIFNFPEYNNIDKAKSFISFIENKDNVVDMLLSSGINDLGITIGEENNYDEIKNCSLITATYRLNGKTIGKIGVIGPTRMEYSKVIPIVRGLSFDLTNILKKYCE